MNTRISIETLLTALGGTPAQQLTLFALLSMGMIESVANGILSAADALQVFFHAENCLFVKKRLRDKTADAIMSHGVQLTDLFDVLPREEAQREFRRELATMRGLCLQLLEERPLVA